MYSRDAEQQHLFQERNNRKASGAADCLLYGADSIDHQANLVKLKVKTFKMVARVSALRRNQYTAVTGKSPTDKEWARINQLSHLTAMDDGVNALLNIQEETMARTWTQLSARPKQPPRF